MENTSFGFTLYSCFLCNPYKRRRRGEESVTEIGQRKINFITNATKQKNMDFNINYMQMICFGKAEKKKVCMLAELVFFFIYYYYEHARALINFIG